MSLQNKIISFEKDCIFFFDFFFPGFDLKEYFFNFAFYQGFVQLQFIGEHKIHTNLHSFLRFLNQ